MKVCILPRYSQNDGLVKVNISFPEQDDRIFWFNENTYELLELVKFKEDFRSWFVGDYVYRDGSFFMMTKLDINLVFLNFLDEKVLSFNDIYHIIKENDVLYKCLTKNKNVNLEIIADVKKIDEDLYVKYNSDKAIKYLRYKIHLINQALKNNQINVLENISSFSNSFEKKDIPISDYTAFSVNLISDYIPIRFVEKLNKIYQITEKTKELSTDNKAPKKRKVGSLEEPTEDYSKLIDNDSFKKQKVLTKSQKQLEKVDKKGMKSITSFFQKKTSW